MNLYGNITVYFNEVYGHKVVNIRRLIKTFVKEVRLINTFLKEVRLKPYRFFL